jgi:hypothetical protein
LKVILIVFAVAILLIVVWVLLWFVAGKPKA